MSVVCASAMLLSLLAWWRLLRDRTPSIVVTAWPDLVVLRPADHISGAELQALSLPIDYPGELQQVVVGEVDHRLPGHLTWLRSPTRWANRKLGHLRHALTQLDLHDRWVIVADSDVLLDRELLCALASASLGAHDLVFAAPTPIRAVGHRASRAVLCHTLHHFRCLFVLGGGAPAVCGKVMALSPAAQRKLLELDDCIAEDLSLAARLPRSAITMCEVHARTLPSPALSRFVRWCQILRAQRPVAFLSLPLLIAPLPWLTGATLLQALDPLWLVGLIVVRALLARALDRDEWWWFWSGEVLLVAAFTVALFRRTIWWRDRQLEVGRGGAIARVVLDAPLTFSDRGLR